MACRLLPEIFDPFALTDFDVSQMNCSEELQMCLAMCVQGCSLCVEINSESEYILRCESNHVALCGRSVLIFLIIVPILMIKV